MVVHYYNYVFILLLEKRCKVFLEPERFKTWVAHFPTYRDGRTGMQRKALGKSDSEAASQLQGRIARAFSSNSW